MKKLTIIIPTFNRNEKLLKTLGTVQQLFLITEVDVRIIDNASDIPVELTIAGSGLVLENLRVHRNSYNVGGNANILRCFEVSQTDWIWILGDSDMPERGALVKIFAAIEQHPDAVRFGFSNQGHEGVCFGLDEFLTLSPAFGEMLFVSSAVFNAKVMRKFLHIGFHFSYSMAPHLALLIEALGVDQKTVNFKSNIVSSDKPDNKDCWPTLPSYLGFTTVLELPAVRKFETHRRLARKIATDNQPIIKCFYQLVKVGLGVKDRRAARYCFTQVALRTVHSTGLLSQLLIFLFLRASLFFPFGPTLIVQLIERRLGRQPIAVSDYRRL